MESEQNAPVIKSYNTRGCPDYGKESDLIMIFIYYKYETYIFLISFPDTQYVLVSVYVIWSHKHHWRERSWYLLSLLTLTEI